MRKLSRLLGIIIIKMIVLFAQVAAEDIMNAEIFFGRVSEKYSEIKDFESLIIISQVGSDGEEMTMEGTLWFKSPDLLRIDFSEPQDQVLVLNKEKFILYLPVYEVSMEQILSENSEGGSRRPESLETIVSLKGLHYLADNYLVAWQEDPAPVPLTEDSEEMVYKLKLTNQGILENFRQIDICVSEDTKLIRKISSITRDYKEKLIDFIDIKINQNIPDIKFEYESPPYANVYNDFLYGAD